MTTADDRETTVGRATYRHNWYYLQPVRKQSKSQWHHYTVIVWMYLKVL
jgi:hypothetical protein